MKNEMNSYTSSERKEGQEVSDVWQTHFQSQNQDVIERADVINEMARIIEVQDKHEKSLLDLDNVVGVAASLKMTGGKPTNNWGLTVLVEKKVAKVSKAARVPATIDGVKTDVLEVGEIKPLAFTAPVRPALPGYSIGHFNITAGTFGCLVRDVRGAHSGEDTQADYLILSNNHVLADVNQGEQGDLILQPGPFDGGVYPADGIATLERFEPIVFGRSGYNLVDAAVARPTYSRNVIASLIGEVIPRGIDQAVVGGLVIKAGRTTQVTVGNVLATNATVNVNYGASGIAQFRNQIITTAMSAPGDSGSLLLDNNLRAIGLLFAGSSVITIHNHIANVELALGVRPVTGTRFS